MAIIVVFCICESNINESMNEDTGIGNPMNVVVGPDCSVIIVLYLLSLSIPQLNNSMDAIIISGVGYSSRSISAGAIPKEITSARESIVSPKTSFAGLGYLLASGPSIASNSTAKNNRNALYIGY